MAHSKKKETKKEVKKKVRKVDKVKPKSAKDVLSGDFRKRQMEALGL